MLPYHQSKLMSQHMRAVFKNTTIYTRSKRFQSHSLHIDCTKPHRNVLFPNFKKHEFPALIPERQMAGHAKWQNIAHIKAAKDRQKNMLSNKYAFLARIAIKEGGTDPKLNNKLATLISEARKNNVSYSVIESALKKGERKNLKYGTIEILGPGGSILILEYETDDISIMRRDIKISCKKYGANVLSGEGRWRAVYEKRGIIKATGEKNGQPLKVEDALDEAIMAGAEEVHTRENEDSKFLEFMCAPDDLHSVKKELEKRYEIEEGFLGYVPTATVKLSKEDSDSADGLLEELGSMSDVVKLYENIE